ncbi:hypothetical protein HYFRA_00000226 [Hymenoscyphus fraxineus]|uniref:Uncharacterized protein n=1 Tax=Hymenoscyphus fraxineus TaxID=746836 RepID=A0A9N9L3F9_9HELO|nr:hypothetical protein HYFRA_00000226 [Hymenoscyphus fraxineus]
MDLATFTELAEQGLVAIKEPSCVRYSGAFGPNGQDVFSYQMPGTGTIVNFYWDPAGTQIVLGNNQLQRPSPNNQALRNMPRVREFGFVQGRPVGPIDTKPNRNSYRQSALGMMVGQIVFPCDRCARGFGNYPFCVTVRDPVTGARLFGGGCMSCKYTDYPHTCSFYGHIGARGNLSAQYVPYPIEGVHGAQHHNTADLAPAPQSPIVFNPPSQTVSAQVPGNNIVPSQVFDAAAPTVDAGLALSSGNHETTPEEALIHHGSVDPMNASFHNQEFDSLSSMGPDTPHHVNRSRIEAGENTITHPAASYSGAEDFGLMYPEDVTSQAYIPGYSVSPWPADEPYFEDSYWQWPAET